MSTLRIVCLSDTHSLHDNLDVPDGDILLHAGDFSSRGTPDEIARFGDFLADLPHTEKIVVAGNHDFLFERGRARAIELLSGATYLEDEGVTTLGLRIWGSPWQPWFHDWAFNLSRGTDLRNKWVHVPDELDVLITHGPPFGILDRTAQGKKVGCEELLKRCQFVQPKLHFFGHIHEAYGASRTSGTLSVNASNCNLRYQPVNPPIVLDWIDGEVTVLSPETPSLGTNTPFKL